MSHTVSAAAKHDPQREHASDTALRPLPGNEHDPSDGLCPVCHRPASVAPAALEYRGKGIVHWECGSCGHPWMTVAHVPA